MEYYIVQALNNGTPVYVKLFENGTISMTPNAHNATIHTGTDFEYIQKVCDNSPAYITYIHFKKIETHFTRSYPELINL